MVIETSSNQETSGVRRSHSPTPGVSLLEEVLAEQTKLSAVDRFSRRHQEAGPGQKSYRDLIPLTLIPGRQLAFEVDLDQCSGCKACVTACHSLNGLEENESWRQVGKLISSDWRHPESHWVTTACHHCADPACSNGCPVLAYEKDAATGIVRHLDDQCIGCQYCLMMCPYEVPSYRPSLGIVRKCDMCSQRLEVGEAPACVQACPNEAIRISLIDPAELLEEYRGSKAVIALNSFLPSSPDPSITLPATRFRSSTPLARELVPAVGQSENLQPAHWPLIWMLVLSQTSVGGFLWLPWFSSSEKTGAIFGLLVVGVIALVASVFHLGRPAKAWRSFLGWRKSWLSREIMIFGLFLGAAFALLGASYFKLPDQPIGWAVWTGGCFAGLLTVLCSSMVYHATRRIFWTGWRVFGKFFGTTLILGISLAALLDSVDGKISAPFPLCFSILLPLVVLGKAGVINRLGGAAFWDESSEPFPRAGSFDSWSLARSARILREQLGLWHRTGLFLSVIGGMILPWVALLLFQWSIALLATAFVCSLLGELAERHGFFRAVVPPSMPGGG